MKHFKWGLIGISGILSTLAYAADISSPIGFRSDEDRLQDDALCRQKLNLPARGDEQDPSTPMGPRFGEREQCIMDLAAKYETERDAAINRALLNGTPIPEIISDDRACRQLLDISYGPLGGETRQEADDYVATMIKKHDLQRQNAELIWHLKYGAAAAPPSPSPPNIVIQPTAPSTTDCWPMGAGTVRCQTK